MPAAPPSRCPWVDTSPIQIRSRLLRLLFRYLPPLDPWAKVEQAVDWPRLIAAAPRDFQPYFNGQILAEANSLEGVCDWLFRCEYRSDRLVGDGRDNWAHPLDFERERKGDCEDFALWAWRRLTEIGYAAEFVVGLLDRKPEQLTANHAWVHVYDRGELRVFETTATRREAMLLTPEAAGARYLPTASIDSTFRTYWYANYFHVRAYGKAWYPPSMHITPPFVTAVEATQGQSKVAKDNQM